MFVGKEKKQLMRQFGEVKGMDASLPDPGDDAAWRTPEVKALRSKLLTQAEYCLGLLDDLEAAMSQRSLAKVAAEWDRVRSSLEMSILVYGN